MPASPTLTSNARRAILARYSIAIAATAAAILIRWLLNPVLGASFPLAILFGAVAAAAWFGGIGPAVVAVVVGYAASFYLFILSPLAQPRELAGNAVALVTYLAICAVIVGLIAAARRATHRSRGADRVRQETQRERQVVTDGAIIVESPVGAAAPDSTRAPSPAGLKILIVDDSRDAATSLAEFLELSGHVVRTANDGYKGLKAADTFRPDVVLLDVGMPGISGHEVAERIRDLPWGNEVVLIAVTGWGHEQDKLRAKESGFDHHFEKPADPDELEQLLASVAAKTRPPAA